MLQHTYWTVLYHFKQHFQASGLSSKSASMETGQKVHCRNRLGKARNCSITWLNDLWGLSRRFDHHLLRNFREILNKYGIFFPVSFVLNQSLSLCMCLCMCVFVCVCCMCGIAWLHPEIPFCTQTGLLLLKRIGNKLLCNVICSLATAFKSNTFWSKEVYLLLYI